MSEQNVPTGFKIWLHAARPKTLPAAAVPVLVGTAAAYADGMMHLPAALWALVCALLIQVGTNLVNDYGDFKKGTDTEERIGPLRVTQAGLVDPAKMKRAIAAVFATAVLCSLYLVSRGGWPIVVVGTCSIVSAVLYTVGPYPLAYLGLGDLFVLVFFGPVAVAGTYYVQALTVNWIVILVGLGPGLISVAILTVNNLRDIEGDRKNGKKTLAVRLGGDFARYEYFYCLVVACLIPPAVHLWTGRYPYITAAAAALLFAPRELKTVFCVSTGPELNRVLAGTGKILLVYGLLLSAGWVASAASAP